MNSHDPNEPARQLTFWDQPESTTNIQRDASDEACIEKSALDETLTLMEEIVDQLMMEMAWTRVRSNRGAPGPDGSKWLQVNKDQLFHPQPAKMLYKKLFVAALRNAGLYAKLPPGVLKFDWVVNIKPVGNGQAVLKYLAPYVYRVAICDNRIVSVDDSGVTYRVKPSGKRVFETRQLSGESFVRAFAQHILPPGFQKVRYYGFMSPNSKLQLANVRWLVWLWKGWTYYMATRLPKVESPQRKPPQCPGCGGDLERVLITGPNGEVIRRFDTPARAPPRPESSTRQQV